MSQNLVIPNKDNKVTFVFGGIDLTLATDIKIQFGAESYTKLLNPTIVAVTSSTELSLDLSATTEVGKIFATVTYFDGASVNGTDITSRELNNSGQIIIAIGSQLIIEDGSIVVNANSFATDIELKAYANIRGFAIPATQPAREALLIQAMDYLTSKESKLSGGRVNIDQELPFPRVGACAKGFNVLSTTIPNDIKKAQMELAIQANTSELIVNKTNKNIQKEKVDTLEISYFNGGSWSQVETGRADAYLKPFYINGGSNNEMGRV